LEEILSKSTFGLRKAGLSALAVTLTLGAGVAGAGAAHADDTGALQSGIVNIKQGADGQNVADLTYTFDNVYQRNSTITFELPDNNCSTQAGTDAAISFTDAPDVSISRTSTAAADTRVPTYTTELESGVCPDTFTVKLTEPSDGANNAGDDLEITLSDVHYDVAKKASTGPVTVTANEDLDGVAGADGTGDTTDNARVVNKSFAFMPLVTANPMEKGVDLGAATYEESSPGAYFPTGTTNVTLTLTDGANFKAGVKPSIEVPAGYSYTNPETTATNTYAFTVTAPADEVAATVQVKGLEADAAGVAQVDIQSNVAGAEYQPDTMAAMNVVKFGAKHRLGGDDRYETAARIFNESNAGNDVAVLSGGQKFPDALSANFLASHLETGTLLTKANKLPQSTKDAILDNGVEKVYITGGDGAVSEEIEEWLEETPVGGNVNSDNYIDVQRLAGDDRYETNERINSWVRSQGGGDSVVFLASGLAPYDSLAAGPVVYNEGLPLVLSRGKELNSGEKQQLIDQKADSVILLGSDGVVSEDVEDELNDDYNVVRLAGADRYATAGAIAKWATESYDFDGKAGDSSGLEGGPTGFTSTTAYITNGRGFADALSAGPLAGEQGAVILLSAGVDKVGAGTADYLEIKEIGTTQNGEFVETLFALGSTGATSSDMIEEAAEFLESAE
jgi:putative cell wall-binding protein